VPRPYRTWGYPVVPLLFLIASLGLLISYAWSQPLVFAVDVAIVLLGGAGVPVVVAAGARQRLSHQIAALRADAKLTHRR
jgi:hypothetical protein